MTLTEIIEMQTRRNEMYIELMEDERRLSSEIRHQSGSHHPESYRMTISYARSNLGEAWERYNAFCTEVKAAQDAYRAAVRS